MLIRFVNDRLLYNQLDIKYREGTNTHFRNTKITHLEPLKLDKTRFHNAVKKGEKQVADIMKAISLCHHAKFYYSTTKNIY